MSRFDFSRNFFRFIGMKNFVKEIMSSSKDGNLKNGAQCIGTFFGFIAFSSYYFVSKRNEQAEEYYHKLKQNGSQSLAELYSVSYTGRMNFKISKNKEDFDKTSKTQIYNLSGYFDHDKEIKVPVTDDFGRIVEYKLFTPFYFMTNKNRFGVNDPNTDYSDQADYKYVEYGVPVYRGK